MGKLYLFMLISLDGFFEGPDHGLDWHNVDEEFDIFAAEQLQAIGLMLFGRRTYELMAGFWPTYDPAGTDEGNRIVAEKMNSIPKVVFSRSLERVAWSKDWDNIRLVREDAAGEIAKLKQQAESDIAIFGSNNLATGLLDSGLIDELRILVNPVAIGQGTSLFAGYGKPLKLELLRTRTFASGNVLLTYRPRVGDF